MRKYLPIIGVLALIKFIIHAFGNRNYGFHRDELLHLSVSEHLDWGYFEFPPFIALIGKISYLFFDYSLFGVRLFPTLAGITILYLCCVMAKEMGGKSKAILLAGVSVLAFLPFYRNHTLFQPVAFDQLFWTLGFFFLVKYIKTENYKFLLLMGATGGLGLMNKYTMLVWGFGIAVGLIFYKKAKLYKSKWLYLSGLLALLIFLPNILWQLSFDIPFLLHLEVLKTKQLDAINPFDFGLSQLDYIFTLAVSLIGLSAMFFDTELKKYKSVGISFLVIFFTMWILQSKAYYFFAAYPIVFAAGAVKIEQLLSSKPKWNYAVVAVLIIPVIPYIPQLTPILPIESYVEYTGKPLVDGRVELTGDYADMFGWEEQVALVDSLYQEYCTDGTTKCVIWAENYGEAGAIKILGDKYGLPDPISRHGSFWLWGYQNKKANLWISIGNETGSVNSVFEETELVTRIYHKYAIGEENGIPVYLCRNPKVDIEQWWKDYEKKVFD
ncbi:MAG: glycosyltransferase family 39 protein [Balneola sp.]